MQYTTFLAIQPLMVTYVVSIPWLLWIILTNTSNTNNIWQQICLSRMFFFVLFVLFIYFFVFGYRLRSGIFGLYCKLKQKSLHAQSCPTLRHPLDCTLAGFSVHGALQARILEWVAISYSRGSSWPRDQTNISCVSCISRWILFH